MSESQHGELVLQVVLMAVRQNKPNTSVILRSDRGIQCASEEYQRFFKDHGLVCGMSAVDSCREANFNLLR